MAAPPAPPKPSLLQRLRQRLAQLRGGDVIITTIAPGASDNVVGKNIIKIGTLVVPALPAVIALIVALVSGVGGLWIYKVPAKMPEGTFNIAVAEFSQIDAQGRISITNDSELVSRTLFTTVQRQLEDLPDDYKALVWHDSMSFMEKRAQIGVIDNNSSDACDLAAKRLGADIIVHGTLDTRTKPALLRLQFCISFKTGDRDVGNLDELRRVDRIGGPLPIVLPMTDTRSSPNPSLRVRANLLARLVVGLRYELATNWIFRPTSRRRAKCSTIHWPTWKIKISLRLPRMGEIWSTISLGAKTSFSSRTREPLSRKGRSCSRTREPSSKVLPS